MANKKAGNIGAQDGRKDGEQKKTAGKIPAGLAERTCESGIRLHMG